ncbi:uncharacterized protein DS421_7g213700 [Arachis hypogaea]|nr:uncharacterized protein DS421_7g213700 [Arachis hypogaea]
MRRSQSARPQSKQAIPTSDLQKKRQPLRPVHVQLILKKFIFREINFIFREIICIIPK